MPLPRPDVDPDGLLEYSVVFSDRSLNHMSAAFVGVMQDLLGILRETYNAPTAVMVPGGGSYAMEAVARQFAHGKRCLVLRNGFFSYRWSQIFEAGDIPGEHHVLKARPDSADVHAAWSPAPIEEVTAAIAELRPELVFAPHVETASGLILPDDYVRAVAAATHAVGGLFVLDCVASGTLWVDTDRLGVDVLISAPQKGWSGSPSAGYVMLGDAARAAIEKTASSSFAIDLKKWLTISEGYAAGRHGYHATVPTDTLRHNVEAMHEARELGLDHLRERQIELGGKVRAALAERGFRSVAAEEYASPTVVVMHEREPGRNTAADLLGVGVQAAAGVSLACDEPDGFATFRIGLFGLDKWTDVDGTVQRLTDALDRIEDGQRPLPGAADTRDWTFVLVERCVECGFDPDYESADTGARVRASVPGWAEVLAAPGATRRPRPTTWSPLEYACHVRDVQRVFAVRLRDMLTLDDARFANWDGEEAAVADRYWAQDPARVAEEVAESAAEIATLWDSVTGDAWQRTGTRGDGKVFTVAEFARYFLHEVEHHLHDARG